MKPYCFPKFRTGDGKDIYNATVQSLLQTNVYLLILTSSL